MQSKHEDHDECRTCSRQLILDAAGRVFAAKGFHAASLREICRLAGVNVALVKYHFSGKDGLYRTTLARAMEESLQNVPLVVGGSKGKSPEERLRAFIQAQVQRIKAPGRLEWYDRLLRREIVEPSEAWDEILGKTVKPMSEHLRTIVSDLLDLPPNDVRVVHGCVSIIGQCLHRHFAGRAVALLYPELGYAAADLEALTEHITAFSLAGLRALRDANQVGGISSGASEWPAAGTEAALIGQQPAGTQLPKISDSHGADFKRSKAR